MSIERIHIDFTFNYGAHPPRPSATPLFTHTRKHLIEDLDTPCEDCGITWSLLQAMKIDPAQSLKVAHIDMELHHDVEWAAIQNDADLAKCVERLTGSDRQALIAAGYKGDSSADDVTLFTDGPWNAKHVLCRPCHIAQHPTPDFRGVHRVGRHYSPSPNEIAVNVSKDGTDPEDPQGTTPADIIAKAAAQQIANVQGSAVEVHHPHHGLVHVAQAAVPHG